MVDIVTLFKKKNLSGTRLGIFSALGLEAASVCVSPAPFFSRHILRPHSCGLNKKKSLQLFTQILFSKFTHNSSLTEDYNKLVVCFENHISLEYARKSDKRLYW